MSHVIPFPVLMKDEKKYSDCVDVLDTFEDWVHTLYSIPDSTADGADETSSTVDSFLPGSTLAVRPDQPGSHIPPTAATDDVLAGVRIPCYGDQLTRVRLAGAKDLRSGYHSPRQRIDHFYPYRIVDWHSKRSFLKVFFSLFPKITVYTYFIPSFFMTPMSRKVHVPSAIQGCK